MVGCESKLLEWVQPARSLNKREALQHGRGVLHYSKPTGVIVMCILVNVGCRHLIAGFQWPCNALVKPNCGAVCTLYTSLTEWGPPSGQEPRFSPEVKLQGMLRRLRHLSRRWAAAIDAPAQLSRETEPAHRICSLVLPVVRLQAMDWTSWDHILGSEGG